MKTAFLSLSLAVLFIACGGNASNSVPSDEANGGSEMLVEDSGEPAPTQTVTAKNYSLEVPEYMTPATDLNAEASLQYQNVIKETYVVVIDEPKEEFIDVFADLGLYDDSLSPLENYAQFQSESVLEMMRMVAKKTELKFTESEGLKKASFSVVGTVEDVPDLTIYYVLGYVEGANTMYTIMGWTLESRIDRYGVDLDQIVASFKEHS